VNLHIERLKRVLRQVDVWGGPAVLEFENTAMTMVPGGTYEVLARCVGPRVTVFRRELGGPQELVFDVDEFTYLDNERSRIAQTTGSNFAVDNVNIRFHNNLHEFLKLSENTPVSTNPNAPNGLIEGAILFDQQGNPITENAQAILYRDFDDHVAPLDGDLATAEEILRDMGADEYGTPQDSTYWWKRF